VITAVLSDRVSTVVSMTSPTIPTIGFCARCLAGAHRKAAVAIVDGTGLCDSCVLDEMHVHDEKPQILHSLRVQDRSEGLGG
jgi:hypothetical protein